MQPSAAHPHPQGPAAEPELTQLLCRHDAVLTLGELGEQAIRRVKNCTDVMLFLPHPMKDGRGRLENARPGAPRHTPDAKSSQTPAAPQHPTAAAPKGTADAGATADCSPSPLP